MKAARYRIIATEFGDIAIVAASRGLSHLFLPEPSHAALRRKVLSLSQTLPAVSGRGVEPVALREDDALLPQACAQLQAYFAGEAVEFDMPLDWSGATSFTRDCWQACREIPLGQTCSYGELAAHAGRPGAARAVGHAMSTNRIPIIVPCHRVLRSDGSLGGYSGPSGVAFKQRLLAMEAAAARQQSRSTIAACR